MTWFQALSSREKVLIAMVAPLAVIALAFQFVWTPLSLSQTQYIDQISAYRLVSDTAALAKQSTTQAAPAQVSTDASEPIANRITRSAEAAEISLRRIEPDNGGIRVTLGDTPFSQLILWLADMEDGQSITVSAIEIDRRPEPGIVSARILLKDL